MESAEIRREMHKLLCYMAASARGLVNEPKMYGPFRLVDAATRLIEIMERMRVAGEFLLAVKERIDAFKYSVMEDEDAFVRGVDEVVTELALGLKREMEQGTGQRPEREV